MTNSICAREWAEVIKEFAVMVILASELLVCRGFPPTLKKLVSYRLAVSVICKALKLFLPKNEGTKKKQPNNQKPVRRKKKKQQKTQENNNKTKKSPTQC